MIHIVKSGDTIASIAGAYGVSESRLRYDNQVGGSSALAVGQALLILIPQTVHRVAPGETLEGIAAAYGTTPLAVVRNNPFLLEDGDLYAGETLVIRYEREASGAGYGTPRHLGGYLYTDGDLFVIGQSMPYLTSMYLFSYGFTVQGSLILPQNAQSWLDMAGYFGVRPVLVLTPLTESGTFNSNLISVMLRDEAVQETLTENLLAEMEKEGYRALDVDFEFVPPADRDLYIDFIGRLTERMNAQGYPVSVALVPKTSDDQQGEFYEGMDYGALGAAANSVLVMAYEWGYT